MSLDERNDAFTGFLGLGYDRSKEYEKRVAEMDAYIHEKYTQEELEKIEKLNIFLQLPEDTLDTVTEIYDKIKGVYTCEDILLYAEWRADKMSFYTETISILNKRENLEREEFKRRFDDIDLFTKYIRYQAISYNVAIDLYKHMQYVENDRII